MLTKTPTWITACLYYGEPWDDLIGKAVKPFTDVVLQTGIAERFYFTRSLDRGPNLRLHLKGDPEVLHNVLKPNLEEHFLQYFDTKPSSRTEPKYSEGFPDSFKWLPNNSIEYKLHEPLLHRFGGEIGWKISESIFAAISSIANHVIRNRATNWNYTEMLGTGMKLHLGLCYAAGMNLQDTSNFFSMMLKDWESKYLRLMGVTINGGINSFELSFKRILKTQQIDMASYVSALWEIFRNIKHLESDEFANWFNELRRWSLELELAIDQGKLNSLPGTFSSSGIVESSSKLDTWSCLSEYIYFTNNNLGIHKQHEGYLLFLLDHSLKKLVHRSQTQLKISA